MQSNVCSGRHCCELVLKSSFQNFAHPVVACAVEVPERRRCHAHRGQVMSFNRDWWNSTRSICGKWKQVTAFTGTLKPGHVVRVHSGSKIDLSDMNQEDATGAQHHIFTGRNYVWKNDCGDTAGLWDKQVWVDNASYDKWPPEGVILVRRAIN
jgi:hypothetical protein